MSQAPLAIFGRRRLGELARRYGLDAELTREAETVSVVLPFRVSSHVLEELIDWDDPASDPMYQLVFPRREMLEPPDYDELRSALDRGEPDAELEAIADRIRASLNPHPAGQADLNVPLLDGEPLAGAQHKYPDTLLFFPAAGQTCHSYCTYCFRWPQFVAGQDRFATRDAARVAEYARRNPQVTDVLVTGGDPLVMRASVLRRSLEPFLAPDLDHLTIRIGTKALSYHPGRFLTDRDSPELMGLLAEVAERRSLSLMAHLSHPRELEPQITREALAAVLAVGATVRCQAPLIRGVNDSAQTWAELWRCQVRLGAIPYYMFVERDTGARRHFEVPLARALTIYTDATARVSGLARTARGPVMSATPGKVLVDGRIETERGPAFVLKLIRARPGGELNRIELAAFDREATWLDDLELLGEPRRTPFEARTPAPATPLS